MEESYLPVDVISVTAANPVALVPTDFVTVQTNTSDV